jgi:tricarballylate dehydrogenase
MINRNGERFVDEGMGLWSRNYSKMGKAIMGQPGCEAVQLFDQKTAGMVRQFFTPTVEPVVAQTLAELAQVLELPAQRLERTLGDYCAAVGAGEFDPTALDGKSTHGLSPDKSNWALTLDSPPYVAFRATAGLTFTFAGLRIDGSGRVVSLNGQAIPGLYAAGECCGGLFYGDYPAGAALMRAAVFGRIAGTSAAGGR